jgi:hypothetical protein
VWPPNLVVIHLGMASASKAPSPGFLSNIDSEWTLQETELFRTENMDHNVLDDTKMMGHLKSRFIKKCSGLVLCASVFYHVVSIFEIDKMRRLFIQLDSLR